MRAGFVEMWGQRGEMVKQLETMYIWGGGHAPSYQNAVRALSDVPPTTAWMAGRPNFFQVPAPNSPGYNMFRFSNSLLQVYKQMLLTATAPVQITEPIGFGGMAGYGRMMRGLFEVMVDPASRKVVFEELERNRLITKDIVNLSIDRSHGGMAAASDFLNKAAGMMSRSHLNKFANEALNELPAALQGRTMMADIMGRAKEGLPPRLADIYYFRLLEYSATDATRLANGQGTSAEYYAAARRATRFSVGSTAVMAQKSFLRNTRAYRFLVPFTSYFSNRVRQFDMHMKMITKLGKEYYRHPSKQNREMFGESAYQMGKFLVGVELAGIAASYIWTFIREGELGVQMKTRELQHDPLHFFWEGFVFGSFGPVWGMMWDTMVRAADPTLPSKSIVGDMVRLALPVALTMDIYDAIKGFGPYKNRDGWERLGRFFQLHTPFLNTVPGRSMLAMYGMHISTPEVAAAERAYWKWRLDPKNDVKPPTGGAPGSQEPERVEHRRWMRRAKDAVLVGKDPFPYLIKAFQVEPRDLRATMRQWLMLHGLEDRKIRELKSRIGPKAFRMLEDRDNAIIRLMNDQEVKDISALGREMGGLKKEGRYGYQSAREQLIEK
jgi:hypothetical protein